MLRLANLTTNSLSTATIDDPDIASIINKAVHADGIVEV